MASLPHIPTTAHSSNLKTEWRSPLVRDMISSAVKKPLTKKENTHGQVYRIGKLGPLGAYQMQAEPADGVLQIVGGLLVTAVPMLAPMMMGMASWTVSAPPRPYRPRWMWYWTSFGSLKAGKCRAVPAG